MELTDAGFVARARSGDTDAFRVLVERHSRALFRLAFRMTGNEQDAEDVVQESFLRAFRQLAKFDERASFGTWLYRIATNCSLDHVRSRKRRSENLAPVDAEMEDPIMALPSGDPTPERLSLVVRCASVWRKRCASSAPPRGPPSCSATLKACALKK